MKSADIKTAFLQGKKIEREVYIQPPKEANTNKFWRLQKYVYGLADASRYWYLRDKKEVFEPYVDDIVYGGTNKFEREIISKLKQTFKFGTEDAEAFTYISTELTQHADFTITMSQKNYINGFS